MKIFVTKKELEQYSLELSKWMENQVLINYNLGKRITKLEQEKKP